MPRTQTPVKSDSDKVSPEVQAMWNRVADRHDDYRWSVESARRELPVMPRVSFGSGNYAS